MAGKVEERRKALRKSLITIAEQRIAEDGLSALRARDLARDAGCALGAIYNVFGDLTELILEVNARTFDRLGSYIAADLSAAEPDPLDQLVTMSHAYRDFAAENINLWRALFDVDRPSGETAPEWYLTEMSRLLAYIDTPLAALFPDLEPEDRILFARALFSSVHGIVLLGLDDASSGVPVDQIDRMIALLLGKLAENRF